MEVCTVLGERIARRYRVLSETTLEEAVLKCRSGFGRTPEEREKVQFRRHALLDLLKKLLTIDPNQRITAADALEHEFDGLSPNGISAHR
jgi:serine/threonine protein kinase